MQGRSGFAASTWLPELVPPRRIAFINEKGGSCKTTLTVHCGAWLARERGLRVLLVDMDPQGQTGKCCGIPVRGLDRTVYDVLRDPMGNAEGIIHQTRIPGLDVLPSNKALTAFPEVVGSELKPQHRLKEALDRLDGAYDVVCIDSPPSLGLLTINIMLAVDEIIVPVSLTYLAMDGCAEILETVERVRAEYDHPRLTVTRIVPTLYRKTRLADAILAKLREHFADRVTSTVLGYNVRIDEAQSHGLTVWEYDPACAGAQMLGALNAEVFAHG